MSDNPFVKPRSMPIFPINPNKIDSNFLAFVTNALATVKPVTCGVKTCQICSSPDLDVVELAHYSRDMIEEWKVGSSGNQFCWSERIGHTDSDIAVITDMPGRKYKLLCLIKFSSQCPNLWYRKDDNGNTLHIRIGFAVPKSHMVRIQLDAVASGYVCNCIL